MARKTTPKNRPSRNLKSRLKSRGKKTKKAGGKKSSRKQSIDNAHKNAEQPAPQATGATGSKKSSRSQNTGNRLKIMLWAATIFLIFIPAAYLGGNFILEKIQPNNSTALAGSAGGNLTPMLALQPYEVPISRQASLRIESFIELKEKQGLKNVCHYMPRFKAAIMGVLSRHFSRQEASAVNADEMTQELRDSIRQSSQLNEILNVHVHSKSIDKRNKDLKTKDVYSPSRLVYCS